MRKAREAGIRASRISAGRRPVAREKLEATDQRGVRGRGPGQRRPHLADPRARPRWVL